MVKKRFDGWLIVSVLLLVLFIAEVFIILSSHQLSRSILRLTRKVSQLSDPAAIAERPLLPEEMPKVTNPRDVEMRELEDVFDKQVMELKTAMRNDAELRESNLRSRLNALQAQINPHFLFNTLNTIASFTRTDPLRARELLREFSSFYRATLDNSGSLIPVSREVAQTKRYLTFEKARFGEDRVLATFDVSEDVEDTLVPAFVIQPIVENAVRHGMGDDDALRIDVTVHQDGEDAILIAVADNGVGMDEGTAARLFDERSARPDASSPQGGGAGVAMHNISERIHRFFGPHSYTRVESAPGKGTKVLLHLDLSESIFDIQE